MIHSNFARKFSIIDRFEHDLLIVRLGRGLLFGLSSSLCRDVAPHNKCY